MFFIRLVLTLMFPLSVHAYPEFIGYKYSSCLTCHYNSQGNGAINDYGRALWSAEIAGRMWAGKKTNEDLAESSGFLGSTKLPWWFKPGFKARQLWYEINPGSSNKSSDSILMQAEANAAFILDKNYKYILVGSYGYVPTPRRYQGQPNDVDNWISRTHYLRWQAQESLFVFAGMMDKAYGIRIVDHTAFSRSRTGLGQNDQVHGIMAHWIKEKYEVTVHPFLGNLFQESDVREQGVSAIVEFDVKEAWRLGFSALTSSNEYIDRQRLAVHSKSGLSLGSSILFEMGLIGNTPNGAEGTQGYYLFSELMQKWRRGYHFFVTGEAYKADMVGSQPTSIKTGLGLLAFPMPRYEVRIEGQNSRVLSPTREVPKDAWALLMQLHLSL